MQHKFMLYNRMIHDIRKMELFYIRKMLKYLEK